MKKLTLVCTAVITGLLLPAMAQAQYLIGVQFPQTYGANPVNPLNENPLGYPDGNQAAAPNGEIAGVIQQDNWNVSNSATYVPPDDANPYGAVLIGPASNATLIDNGGLPTSLIDSNGNVSSVLFSYTGVNTGDSYASNSFAAPSVATGLHADSFLATAGLWNSSGGNTTLTLSGLNPLDTYNLVAYVNGPWYTFGGVHDTATIGSTSYNYQASTNLSSWVNGSSTTPGAGTASNFVEFTGLTGAASETLTLSGSYNGLQGFQLQDVGEVSVPEPSTVWMFSLGFLGLMVHVYRKRYARV